MNACYCGRGGGEGGTRKLQPLIFAVQEEVKVLPGDDTARYIWVKKMSLLPTFKRLEPSGLNIDTGIY